MKKAHKNLSLRAETVRVLATTELERAAGGAPPCTLSGSCQSTFPNGTCQSGVTSACPTPFCDD